MSRGILIPWLLSWREWEETDESDRFELNFAMQRSVPSKGLLSPITTGTMVTIDSIGIGVYNFEDPSKT